MGVLLSVFTAQSQYNYVQNPSFEERTGCPSSPDDLHFCNYWQRATAGTSDYFNACDQGNFGVPYNLVGFQEAHTGNAYAGLIAHAPYESAQITPYTEYIEQQLKSPLIKDIPYKISFYVSLAEDVSTYAIKNIGAVVSPMDLGWELSYAPITNVPPPIQLTSFITNTQSWTLVSGTYISLGEEQQITIGNFFKHTDTESIIIGNGWDYYAYYYIDDVSIVVDYETLYNGNYGNGYNEPTSNYYEEDNQSYDIIIPNVITPNDDNVNDIFYIKYLGYLSAEMIILNRWGKTIFTGANVFNQEWSPTDIIDGVYYYTLKALKPDSSYDTFTGSITVING